MLGQLQSGGLRKRGLETGLVTEDDLKEMVIAWKEWKDADDATLGMTHGEIVIKK